MYALGWVLMKPNLIEKSVSNKQTKGKDMQKKISEKWIYKGGEGHLIW